MYQNKQSPNQLMGLDTNNGIKDNTDDRLRFFNILTNESSEFVKNLRRRKFN